MITAIIIDDEAHNRNVLRTLLQKHCPDIKVLDEAESAAEAFFKVIEQKPQLLFLDIKMPGKSGFDLLKLFKEIDFEVIFVSAFDEYAIKAFEFNALDYILKPIDYVKLTKAVSKAVAKIKTHDKDDTVLHFVKTLADKNDLISKFSVHHNGKVVFVNVNDVEFIEAKTDFCELYLKDGSHYTSSKDLKLFEDVLAEAGNFIRVNRSVIVNTNYLKGYTKGEVCIIELVSGHHFEVSRRKKTEIIGKLRSIAG
jgi:two-component system, LytTR family, response regulator